MNREFMGKEMEIPLFAVPHPEIDRKIINMINAEKAEDKIDMTGTEKTLHSAPASFGLSREVILNMTQSFKRQAAFLIDIKEVPMQPQTKEEILRQDLYAAEKSVEVARDDCFKIIDYSPPFTIITHHQQIIGRVLCGEGEVVPIIAGWTGIMSLNHRPIIGTEIINNNLGKIIHYETFEERNFTWDTKATRSFWEGRLEASLALQRETKEGKREGKGKPDGKKKVAK